MFRIFIALISLVGSLAATCYDYETPTDLGSVYGRLCLKDSAKPVIFAVHGATYYHSYWDWSTDYPTYSFVQAALGRGYNTFIIDRPGNGQSSRAPATEITMNSEAEVVHQIVSNLRSGFYGKSFAKVVLVTHSLGSFIGNIETNKYSDVDAFVPTGFAHVVNLINMTTLLLSLYPTQLDPILAPENFPLGYLTTVVGTRGEDFYNVPDADPAVIAEDELTKQIATSGEIASFLEYIIQVPNNYTGYVLTVNGQNDKYFCYGQCSVSTPPLSEEAEYYPNAVSNVAVIPIMGHDINLHYDPSETYDTILNWIDSLNL